MSESLDDFNKKAKEAEKHVDKLTNMQTVRLDVNFDDLDDLGEVVEMLDDVTSTSHSIKVTTNFDEVDKQADELFAKLERVKELELATENNVTSIRDAYETVKSKGNADSAGNWIKMWSKSVDESITTFEKGNSEIEKAYSIYGKKLGSFAPDIAAYKSKKEVKPSGVGDWTIEKAARKSSKSNAFLPSIDTRTMVPDLYKRYTDIGKYIKEAMDIHGVKVGKTSNADYDDNKKIYNSFESKFANLFSNNSKAFKNDDVSSLANKYKSSSNVGELADNFEALKEAVKSFTTSIKAQEVKVEKASKVSSTSSLADSKNAVLENSSKLNASLGTNTGAQYAKSNESILKNFNDIASSVEDVVDPGKAKEIADSIEQMYDSIQKSIVDLDKANRKEANAAARKRSTLLQQADRPVREAFNSGSPMEPKAIATHYEKFRTEQLKTGNLSENTNDYDEIIKRINSALKASQAQSKLDRTLQANATATRRALDSNGLGDSKQSVRLDSAVKNFNAAKASGDFKSVTKSIEYLEKAIAAATNKIKGFQTASKIASDKIKSDNDAEVKKVREVVQAYERSNSVRAAKGNSLSGKELIQSLENQKRKLEEVSRAVKKESDAYYLAQAAIAKVNSQMAKEIANMNNKKLSSISGVVNTISQVSSAINSGVNKIISMIRGAVSIIHTTIKSSITIVQTVKTGVHKVIELFGNLGNRVASLIPIIGPMLQNALSRSSSGTTRLGSSMNILKGTATELRSKILLITGAFKGLFSNTLVNNANTLYRSLYSLQDIIGNDATNNTVEFYNKLQDTFGLSAANLIAQIDELSGVLYGLGASSSSIQKMSESLNGAATYMALMGAKGGETQEVVSSLQSVLEGMPRAGYGLGISTRDSAMNEFVKDLKGGTTALGKAMAEAGIPINKLGNTFSDLTEAQKVYLRYAKVIQDTAGKYDNFSNMAGVLETITGKVYMMKQAFTSLGYAIGQIMYKALASVAPYITAVVNLVTEAINKLSALLGTKFNLDLSTEIKATDDITDNTGALKDDAEAIAEATTTTAQNLTSFDKIESIDSSTDSGKGAKAIDLSGIADIMPNSLGDMADKMSSSYADKLQKNLLKKVNEITANIKSKVQTLADGLVGHKVDLTFGFKGTQALKALKSTLNSIKETVLGIIKLIAYLGIRMAEDLKAGRLLNDFLDILAAVFKLVQTVVQALTPAIKNLYENYLSKYVKVLGDILHDKLQGILKKIEGITAVVKIFGEALAIALNPASTLEELSKLDKFKEAYPHLGKFIDGVKVLAENVGGLFSIFKENRSSEEQTQLDTLTEKLPTIVLIAEGLNSIKGILKEVLGILGEVLKSTLEFVKEEILPWLVEKLGKLKEYLAKNHDQIVKFVEVIRDAAWFAFRVFIFAVSKFIKLCIAHPKAVVVIFYSLMALKVGAWFGGVVVNAVKLYDALQKIKTIVKGFKAVKTATTAMSTDIGTAAIEEGAKINALPKAKGIVTGIKSAAGAIAPKVLPAISKAAVPVALTAGLVMGGKDAYKTSKDSEKIFGSKEGKTMSAKVTSGVGGYLGGNNYGLADETMSAGEKAKNVAMGALKGAALGGSIGSVIPGIGTAIGAAVGGVVGTVTGAIGGDNIAKALNGAWEGMKGGASSVGEFVSTKFAKLSDNVSTSTSIIATNIGPTFERAISTVRDGAANAGVYVQSALSNIGTVVGSVAGSISSKFKNAWAELKSGATSALDTIKGKVSSVFSGAVDWVGNKITGSSSNAIRSIPNPITSHAVGGGVKKGNMFIANEDGAELVGNITGASGAQVANNSMIIKAIYTAVYNAMAEVMSQSGGKGSNGGNTINIGSGGLNVIDSSSVKKLAKMLAPYLGVVM